MTKKNAHFAKTGSGQTQETLNKSTRIFASQEASGRQLIYKNHATAAAEAAADGVEGGGNGGGGREGGRRKRMLRKR